MAKGQGSPLWRLHDLGQSVWYDNIRRGVIRSGELARLAADDAISGVTSNPTIFEKAIDGSEDYDAAIATMSPNLSLADVYRELTEKDIQEAADVLRPVFDRTGGADGYVSVEVPPDLARDAKASVEEGLRLRKVIDRPNVMVKIPATPEGEKAIEELTYRGVPVNVTLIFSLAQHRGVAEAYWRGLERRLAEGLSNADLRSVASFFVSRVDTKADAALEERAKSLEGDARERVLSLRGKVGIANARQAYRWFLETLKTPRWGPLVMNGAHPQRPLWASTGTKNAAYSDVLYVEALAGPETVNTMPPKTIEAYQDHGRPRPEILGHADVDETVLAELANAGIDLDAITSALLEEGLGAFEHSFATLMDGLQRKRELLRKRASQTVVVQLPTDSEQVVAAALKGLASEKFADRLRDGDVSLWGGDEDPARARSIQNGLGWRVLPTSMRVHIPELSQFAKAVAADGMDHAVILGMGGSSLCPDLLAHSFEAAPGRLSLTVLDSTDPAAVDKVQRSHDPVHTLYVVSSKSGTTTEPLAFFHRFWQQASETLGAEKVGAHFTAITDPGTALGRLATERGFRKVWENPADVGGRYSALSLFGLVPAALLGLDLEEWLDRASAIGQACAPERAAEENPGLRLGAVLGALGKAGQDKVTLFASSGIDLFGDWAEQLLAESTGKEGTGLLPVAHEPLARPDAYGTDRVFVSLEIAGEPDSDKAQALEALAAAGHPVVHVCLASRLDLAGQFLLWEIATAAAGHILGINSFDQPNVQESKDNTVALLKSAQKGQPLTPPGPVHPLGDGMAFEAGADGASGLSDAVATWLRDVPEGGYVAIMAYLTPDPALWQALTDLRVAVRAATGAATTGAYGPRFLHSTGQYHKGGRPVGAFLQFVGSGGPDLAIPELPYGFKDLIAAQSLGDLKALTGRGRPVLRVAVTGDAATAVGKVAQAVRAVSARTVRS